MTDDGGRHAGLVARARRFVFGDRIQRARVSDHGAFMRTLGRGWAIPMTLVFSSGALITLGQKQITELVSEWQHQQPLNYVVAALLAITFVIVGGMDLTLLNSAVELRDARLRGVDPGKDPHTQGARLRVWLVSLIESATFMSVAYQLDQPPSPARDLVGCLVAWAFIAARAFVAPVCAMYLATLGKRAMVRREMYGNLLLTIGGTIQQILENLQFAADERLIEPLWRMQVLVDRASRAQTDAEMDRFDEQLLASLAALRTLRGRLGVLSDPLAPVSAASAAPAPFGVRAWASEVEEDGAAGGEGVAHMSDTPTEESSPMPTARWSRQQGDRIEAWALGELAVNGAGAARPGTMGHAGHTGAGGGS